MGTPSCPTAVMASTGSPVSAAYMPRKMTIRPMPPLSTTPACFSTGSISGVRFNMASPTDSTSLNSSTTSSCLSRASSASSAITRETVRIVPSLGFMTAL